MSVVEGIRLVVLVALPLIESQRKVCYHVSGFVMQANCGRVFAIAFTERMLVEVTSCAFWLEEGGLEEVWRSGRSRGWLFCRLF